MRPAPSALPFRPARALTLGLALTLAACGGSDGPTSPDGDGGGDGGGVTTPTVKDNPSFAQDVVPMFSRNGCTGCHAAGGEAGLNLSGSPHAALVNVPSTQTREPRVIPGNANDSYLVKKLEGRASFGQKMPPGGQVNAVDLANLKNWINRGAANN